MIDLNKIVNDKMVEIEKDGFIEKVIEKNLKQCLESSIENAFGYGGPMKEKVKDYVKENLTINLDKLDIPKYNALVVQQLNKKLGDMIKIKGIENLNECMERMLMDVKEEYTLTEIIEKLKKSDYKDSCEYDYDDYLSLHIEDGGSGYTHIYMDLEPNKSRYECDFKIDLGKEGKIYSTKLSDIDIKTHIGNLYGVEELIFKIYSSGAKIILDNGMDPDDYDTSLGEDY